ncbi:hypothetical protein PG995_005337 [Apiospora arundinis]
MSHFTQTDQPGESSSSIYACYMDPVADNQEVLRINAANLNDNESVKPPSSDNRNIPLRESIKGVDGRENTPAILDHSFDVYSIRS